MGSEPILKVSETDHKQRKGSSSEDRTNTYLQPLFYLFESQSGKLRKISTNELKPNCDRDCRNGRKLEKDLFFLLFSSRPEQQRKKKKERKVCIWAINGKERERKYRSAKKQSQTSRNESKYFLLKCLIKKRERESRVWTQRWVVVIGCQDICRYWNLWKKIKNKK